MSVKHPEVEKTWKLEQMLKAYKSYPCFQTDVARIKLELERRGEIALGDDERAALNCLINIDKNLRTT